MLRQSKVCGLCDARQQPEEEIQSCCSNRNCDSLNSPGRAPGQQRDPPRHTNFGDSWLDNSTAESLQVSSSPAGDEKIGPWWCRAGSCWHARWRHLETIVDTASGTMPVPLSCSSRKCCISKTPLASHISHPKQSNRSNSNYTSV